MTKHNLIEPNYFKMRLPQDVPKWTQFIFKMFGTKTCGTSDGYYCEGYWLNGLCLVTKFEEIQNDQAK